MNNTYAIVDIETTGTDQTKDRIIQFGCVLVENNQIVSRFATDINPMQPIPKQIQSLTNIPNKRVKKAPLFEDVAETIYNLLENTVFVAHNIHFDYHFLNHEMQRCGLPPLKIPGIDTVELAQIFLPTEVSFRLSDLAENLGLTHERPHQADSDAAVTASLFLFLQETMRQLPLVTMEKIGALSPLLSMQTGLFIQRMVHELQLTTSTLDENIAIVEGLALQKKTVQLFEEAPLKQSFPITKKEKLALYQEKLDYRKEQGKLMNNIYRHFTIDSAKDLLIEASTGMGKTLGYLLPAHYLATPKEPVVISTVSILLQQQILNQDIPLLNTILEHPIQATIIKSKTHYIDLQRFKATLDAPIPQKQYALYQMGILVWLTQTVTGDFDELNLVRLDHPLFQEIQHRGVEYLVSGRPLYQFDFLRHLQAQIMQSNVLIINHALLAQETQRKKQLIPTSRYLIIDEAHHLPEIMEKVSNVFIDTAVFEKKINQFQEEGQLFDLIEMMIDSDQSLLHLFQLYREIVQAIVDVQNELFSDWIKSFDITEETIVSQQQRKQVSLKVEKRIQRMLLHYEEAVTLQQQILTKMTQLRFDWLNRQQLLFGTLINYFEELAKHCQIMNDWFSNWATNYVHFIYPYNNRRNVKIQLVDFTAAILPNTRWYERYENIVYIGGTLRVSGNRNYFANKLGIAGTQLKVMPTSFDYSQQAQLSVLASDCSIKDLTIQEYEQFLVKNLSALIRAFKQPVLVLFTSHQLLQKVYERMHMHFLEQGREIIAQGVGGSREKLLKRFVQSKDSILFGADSFWEGVDLPGDTLQILIVTRLPFENPERLMVQARYAYLKEAGVNPFTEETLPKAALKLRQGLGRLIRSETDRGVMIVLDQRIVTTKYGKKIIRALPKELPLLEQSIEEIKESTLLFLEK